jgi:hypothetical protein
MSYNSLPFATYADYRYISWRLLNFDKTTFSVNSTSELLTTWDNKRHGILKQAYPITKIDAAFPDISVFDALPMLHDMTHSRFGETIYYVYDPLLSKLRYTSGDLLPQDTSLSIFMSLRVRPTAQVGNYVNFVTGVETTYFKAGKAYRVFKPVAIRRNNALHVQDANYNTVASINYEPLATPSQANPSSLPALACCWRINAVTYAAQLPYIFGANTLFYANEIYHVCTLESLNVELLGVQAPPTNNVIPAFTKDTMTALLSYQSELTDYLHGSFEGAIANSNEYSDQLISGYNEYFDSYDQVRYPYTSNSGVALYNYGEPETTSLTSDFVAAKKTKLDVSATFQELYVQLPGITGNTYGNA